MLLVLNAKLSAQENKANLGIGDRVPAFKYGLCLKGAPVKKFEKGHLYLFEFWATWCGPCIASMPHLSEFAKKHKQDATVIAVNIWESSHGKNSYESTWPKITKFVKGMGENMGFNVVTDSKDQFMGNKWMKAAGQDGIPCTFIVKDSVILWIGHPIELDSIVELVNSGHYDPVATKKETEARQAKSDSIAGIYKKYYDSYEKAIADKKYDLAMQILDSGSIAAPDFKGTFGFFKFMALLEVRPDTALAFVKEWQKSGPGYVGSVAAVIAKKKGLPYDLYEYALESWESLLSNPQMPTSMVYENKAMLYANMEDYKKAVENQEKAIAEGKQAIKDKKFIGFIMDDTIKGYEKVLSEYKSKLK
ncbi:thiol-disulfide isomerase-like thioredoxin [Filimonas lacunae]|nr:thiol-disulfide isomerase-like thioredoxin [Filimonas lacunae]